jgi:putative tryptophan/tyrosine transport system substrate-binding protein
MLRVGVVSAANPRTTSFWVSFVRRMRELGYTEGQNFLLDFTNLQGQLDRYPKAAAELVQRKVDVIIASGVEIALKSALAASETVPVVMVAIDYDPFALGYVSNHARPDRNVTGVFFPQLELTGKRLEFLKEALPDLTSVTVLWDRISADQWHVVQRVAPMLGLRCAGVELGQPPIDYDHALSQVPSDHRGALVVLMTPALFLDRARLAEAAIRQSMASIFGLRGYAEAGGLISYGSNIDVLFERAADYVDRIAKGGKPGDLPVEQPTRLELVINLKTARALGLTIPPTFLARADEVIE